MTKFKIEGTCIDTSTMKGYVPAAILGSSFDYILTSIPANNDVLIKDYVGSFKFSETKLIVHASHLDGLCDTVKSHVELVGRDYVDILLVDSKADWKLAGSEVVGLGDRCKAWGIMEPESVEEVKKIVETVGSDSIVKYIALTINPLEFNLDLINYCTDNGILVIGLNPLGGYLSAPRNITAFTVPYLLGFSAFYSDITVISGRNLDTADNDSLYLSGLKGKDAGNNYVLKKSTNKPVKGVSQAVFTSFKLKDEIIPYDDPTMCLYADQMVLEVGKPSKKLKKTEPVQRPPKDTDDVVLPGETDSSDSSKFVEQANHLLNILHLPSDGDESSKFAVAKYKLLDLIKCDFSSAVWSYDFSMIGKSVMMVLLTRKPVKKGMLWWKKEIPGDIRTFYLLQKEGKFVFREIFDDPEPEPNETASTTD